MQKEYEEYSYRAIPPSHDVPARRWALPMHSFKRCNEQHARRDAC